MIPSRVGKARLRGALRKLAAIPCDPGDRPVAAQEALDYLAMVSGLKPVCLLGRGFDPPGWVDGVLAIARDQDMHVIEGPYWNAAADDPALPPWFVDHMRRTFEGQTAWYLCRAAAVAEEVRSVCRTGRPTVAQEARMLGYPECCVTAHYARTARYQEVWLGILRREAGDDEDAMRERLADGAPLAPANDAERSALEAVIAVTQAPFTSVNMCAACEGDPDGAAQALSRRYRALAEGIDRGLVNELAVSQAAGGR